MINGAQPLVLGLQKRISTSTPGDPQFFGGRPPFMPGRWLPQAWNTPFGVTDAAVRYWTIPKPILFAVNGLQLSAHGIFHPIAAMSPYPSTKLWITGTTWDNTGAALAGCTVRLFRTSDNKLFETLISDANGNFGFSSVGLSEQYYIVAYRAGNPDVAGVTVNTLTGAM